MNKAAHKYERVNCIRCHAPCAWCAPNKSHAISIICNLCRFDEWATLRWLNLVTAITPTTIGDEERQLARWQQSTQLSDTIRESTLPTETNTATASNIDNLLADLDF